MLTVNTSGSGSVSRNPTNTVVPQGAVVTLTAVPADGWSFAAWSGDASGTNNPINVTMDTDKTITANFAAIPIYTLTVSNNGPGSVSPPGGSYTNGTVVSLTATASNGWLFVNWSGAASGTNNPLNVTMTADKFIIANYAQLPAIVTQPTNAIAAVGDTVTFSVAAVGAAPLSYQWRFNGAPLAAATGSTLTLTNVQPAQEGGYSVLVSNPYGATPSQSATLAMPSICTGTNVLAVCDEAGLRQAIALGGSIQFCCNGTITLTNTINVTKSVTLDASGRSIVINGNNAVRLFNVSTGITFIVTNITLANGRHQGTNGVNATSAQPATPGETGVGGAIYNLGGTVRLVSCLLTNNRVRGGQGSLGSSSYPKVYPGGDGRGGAVFNAGGSIILQNVLAVSNSAAGGDGVASAPANDGRGGVLYNAGGTVLIANSVIASNRCDAPQQFSIPFGVARGGAIYQEGGSLTLTGSVFTANLAVGAAPPISLTPNRPAHAHGGVLDIASGTLFTDRARFIDNAALGGGASRGSGTGEAKGGAVYCGGTSDMRNSTFSGNQAISGNGSNINTDGTGGALYNTGPAVLNGNTFASNFAKGGDAGSFGSPTASYPGGHGFGGAIYNQSDLRATNCTITDNRAQAGAASGTCCASYGNALGGGLHSVTGIVQLANVTIASNSVVSQARYLLAPGLARGANISSTNSTVTLFNSCIAYSGTNGNCWGAVVDGGYNLSDDGSCNFSGGASFNFTDPRLKSLADNGGPTWTMALYPDSPAIDFGSAAGAPSTDQRGQSRPYGAGVDIGAYEVGAAAPLLACSRNGSSTVITFNAEATVAYDFLVSADFHAWELYEAILAQPTNSVVVRTIPTAPASKRFWRAQVH